MYQREIKEYLDKIWESLNTVQKNNIFKFHSELFIFLRAVFL